MKNIGKYQQLKIFLSTVTLYQSFFNENFSSTVNSYNPHYYALIKINPSFVSPHPINNGFMYLQNLLQKNKV